MKISKIKKELKNLFAGKPKNNTKNIDSMLVLIDLLKDKKNKLENKLKNAKTDDDKHEIKRKLKLVKKQIIKANEHVAKLKNKGEKSPPI